MADVTPATSPAQSKSTPETALPTTAVARQTDGSTHPTEHVTPSSPEMTPVVCPDDTHRCPLHKTAADCYGVRIKPEDEEITSQLVGSIKITFDATQERLRCMTRGQSNRLPPILYRTFYELSATLSSRVSEDTHVRHRENEELKLRPGNAFQTVGEVNFEKNLTKEGIERHLVWNKKKHPSTWISMFDTLSHAKRRAVFHYEQSNRIGQRVTIAEISTADLIPATIHATCRSEWKIFTRDKYYGKRHRSSITTRPVDIPIWIHRSLRPQNASSISPEQLMASCAELFVCIKELRNSNLVQGPNTHSRRRTISADGHSYEWLSLGRILESRLIKVIPFDGVKFHTVKPTYTVRSKSATDDWIVDFERGTWRLESEMNNPDMRKRKRTNQDDGALETSTDNVCKHKSNAQDLHFSLVSTVYANV